MSAVYASTSPLWFRALSDLDPVPRSVAFWRPSNVRAKLIEPGEPWFFKEWGAPQVLGFGRFVRYETTTPRRVWNEYGPASGSSSEEELLGAIATARQKQTTAETTIGNVVLDEFTRFEPPIQLADINLPNLPVPFQYVPAGNKILGLVGYNDPVERRPRHYERLPSELLNKVTAENIWNAVTAFRTGSVEHKFGDSTDFDVVCDDGFRLAPKAVFGLAATEALGFEVLPRHFSAGEGTPCFRILRESGLDIVAKGGTAPVEAFPVAPEDQEWVEGGKKLILHLRSERARGLAAAKKAAFKRVHGHLFCERCGRNPQNEYSPLVSDSCIEVHHHSVHVKDMAPKSATSLDDLQCLCANCHRITHRELRLKDRELLESGSISPTNVRELKSS